MGSPQGGFSEKKNGRKCINAILKDTYNVQNNDNSEENQVMNANKNFFNGDAHE